MKGLSGKGADSLIPCRPSGLSPYALHSLASHAFPRSPERLGWITEALMIGRKRQTRSAR